MSQPLLTQAEADEAVSAILELYSTLCLMYKMDGYVPTWGGEPFKVPFARNVDAAVDRFNKPGTRQNIVRALYGEVRP